MAALEDETNCAAMKLQHADGNSARRARSGAAQPDARGRGGDESDECDKIYVTEHYYKNSKSQNKDP